GDVAPFAPRRRRSRLPRLPPLREIEDERLSNEILAEAPVPFLAREAEPRVFVEVARGVEPAVRPQHHPAVAGAAREVDAFADKPPSDAGTPRRRVDNEEPQLRDGRRLLDDEHG